MSVSLLSAESKPNNDAGVAETADRLIRLSQEFTYSEYLWDKLELASAGLYGRGRKMNDCQDSESRWEGTLHPGRSKDGDMTGATRPSDISEEEKHMWIRLKMVQGGQDTSVTHNILHYCAVWR
jgi:hypothetical protein